MAGLTLLDLDGVRQADGSRPTYDREAGDALKVGEVIGHERRGKGEGMRGDQQVHGADRLTGSFQVMPDATVMRGAASRLRNRTLRKASRSFGRR